MKREIFTRWCFRGPGRLRDRLAKWRGVSHAQGPHCSVGKARVRCNPRRLSAGNANRVCA